MNTRDTREGPDFYNTVQVGLLGPYETRKAATVSRKTPISRSSYCTLGPFSPHHRALL